MTNEFASLQDAQEWMVAEVDDECIDNYRFAWLDESQAEYDAAYENGCCGCFDSTITINGRWATIGCNYGH